jgi:hypothetical protein
VRRPSSAGVCISNGQPVRPGPSAAALSGTSLPRPRHLSTKTKERPHAAACSPHCVSPSVPGVDAGRAHEHNPVCASTFSTPPSAQAVLFPPQPVPDCPQAARECWAHGQCCWVRGWLQGRVGVLHRGSHGALCQQVSGPSHWHRPVCMFCVDSVGGSQHLLWPSQACNLLTALTRAHRQRPCSCAAKHGPASRASKQQQPHNC